MKVGGQALPDGVLMRTDRTWAIARADGSVEVGAFPPRTGLARVPGLRVLVGVVGALRLAFGRRLRQGRKLDRRLVAVLVAVEAGVVASSLWVPGVHDGSVLFAVVVPWVLTLGALRLATPRALWRYHGAEHKAVAAYEVGVDLHDTAAVLRQSRVHDRCGTNLVFLMLVCAVAFAGVSAVLQVPAFLLSLALSAEVIGLAASRPRAWLSRALLVGGRLVQRFVTTAEPTAAEQAVACRALQAALGALSAMAASSHSGERIERVSA